MLVRSLQLLSLLASATPSLAGIALANTSSAALECRCGMSQFLSLPHANITDPVEAKRCVNYKLIDARGTAEPQGVSTMFFPVIENILANKSGGVSLPVEYPAGPSQNTTSGENFGASLMLSVLARLNTPALEAVKSVILVGNPYRIPGKASNVDETAQHDASSSVRMFAAQAIASYSTILQLAPEVDRGGKVLDYCLEGDLVCSRNPGWNCQIPAGHLSYGLVESVVDMLYAVSEEEILDAMKLIFERLKLVVEPAAVLPLAVALYNEEFREMVERTAGEPGWDVGIILSGGNVGTERIAELFSR